MLAELLCDLKRGPACPWGLICETGSVGASHNLISCLLLSLWPPSFTRPWGKVSAPPFSLCPSV